MNNKKSFIRKYIVYVLFLVTIISFCVMMYKVDQRNKRARQEHVTILPIGMTLCGSFDSHTLILCSDKEDIPTVWWVYDSKTNEIVDEIQKQVVKKEKGNEGKYF